MDMDQAAVFLAGSILTVMGFLIILVGIVVANNIIHTYWKSFGWSWMPWWANEPQRFATQEEVEHITPTFEKKSK
jgi:uncharacterized membrane protein